MNLKVAHLVSVQFGIFVGIVSCLVVSRFEFAKLRPATESAAVVEPISESENQRDYAVDQRVAPEPVEPATEQPAAPLPNEYSPEAAERYRALAEKLYYEQIAPRPRVSSAAVKSSIPVSAPAYTETVQEPEVVQIQDPAPQPVAYVQPPEVIVYPPVVQYVVLSHPRRIVNRCRPAPHRETLASNQPRRPGGGGTHLSGSPPSRLPRPPGEMHRDTGASSCPSPSGFAHRGKR